MLGEVDSAICACRSESRRPRVRCRVLCCCGEVANALREEVASLSAVVRGRCGHDLSLGDDVSLG